MLYPDNIRVLHTLAALYKDLDTEQAFTKRAYALGSDSPEIHTTYNQLASLL